MNLNASHATIRGFLVDYMGYTVEKAEEVIDSNLSIVDRGQRLGSFAYYVASELHDKVKEDLFDGKEPPEDWDGYDPDWEESEEIEDDEDEEEEYGDFDDGY